MLLSPRDAPHFFLSSSIAIHSVPCNHARLHKFPLSNPQKCSHRSSWTYSGSDPQSLRCPYCRVFVSLPTVFRGVIFVRMTSLLRIAAWARGAKVIDGIHTVFDSSRRREDWTKLLVELVVLFFEFVQRLADVVQGGVDCRYFCWTTTTTIIVIGELVE